MGPWNQASLASWASTALRAFDDDDDALARCGVAERDAAPALGGISGDGRAAANGSAAQHNQTDATIERIDETDALTHVERVLADWRALELAARSHDAVDVLVIGKRRHGGGGRRARPVAAASRRHVRIQIDQIVREVDGVPAARRLLQAASGGCGGGDGDAARSVVIGKRRHRRRPDVRRHFARQVVVVLGVVGGPRAGRPSGGGRGGATRRVAAVDTQSGYTRCLAQ